MKKFIFTTLLLVSSFAFSNQESEKLACELTREIILKAEKKWGTNYKMQIYEIKKQLNSLNEVVQLKLELLLIEEKLGKIN